MNAVPGLLAMFIGLIPAIGVRPIGKILIWNPQLRCQQYWLNIPIKFDKTSLPNSLSIAQNDPSLSVYVTSLEAVPKGWDDSSFFIQIFNLSFSSDSPLKCLMSLFQPNNQLQKFSL